MKIIACIKKSEGYRSYLVMLLCGARKSPVIRAYDGSPYRMKMGHRASFSLAKWTVYGFERFRRKTSKTTPWRCETLSFRGGEDARRALCFVLEKFETRSLQFYSKHLLLRSHSLPTWSKDPI